MERLVGTVSRGIRAPIIREGDDIVDIVTNAVLSASQNEEWGFNIHDRDIIAVTEAVVARAQGNYATIDDIAADVEYKFGKDKTIAVISPILSRNRFAICLKGIAKAAKRIILVLSFPTDEVGNRIFPEDHIFHHDDMVYYKDYEELYGKIVHPFTGINYPKYYKELVEEQGAACDIIFSNNPTTVLSYTKNILCCDIHTSSKDLFKYTECNLYTLSDILDEPINDSGYNKYYGLLGSNKANEDTVKLFPRDSQYVVDGIQEAIFAACGKKVEVLIYGDGCFKDPIGGIWEFADPVVAPFYTSGLEGTPNELKIKYLADNDFINLKENELADAIKSEIKKKDTNLKGNMVSEGTTPRRYIDLIGSLCDLTSGSGDKGTPIVYIQGYFDNYTSK